MRTVNENRHGIKGSSTLYSEIKKERESVDAHQQRRELHSKFIEDLYNKFCRTY